MGVMAGLSERMLAHAGRDVEVTTGTDRRATLDGADFVITQIRVGGMAARHLDESIPPKYGIVGQETTGPGGMFKALRTLPHMIDIARDVADICPRAFILSYTNPSGIVTEAVGRHTDANFVGMCSGMPNIQDRLAERFADIWPDLKTYCVGLNHLGFVYRFVAGGQDVTADAVARVVAHEREHDNADWARTVERFGAVPIGYVNHYVHPRDSLKHYDPAANTRAQDIMAIERDLFAEAADPKTVTKPEILKRRGGGGYANITFKVMRAIVGDTGQEWTVSTRNGGAVDGIDPDAAVEVTCRIGAGGPEPIPVGPMPVAFGGLVQQVKAYETLVVEAAVTRSRATAVRALMNHPLCDKPDVAEALVDEMLAAHGLAFE